MTLLTEIAQDPLDQFLPFRFPFARSATMAVWPSDIPRESRKVWKDSRRNFSAVWRVPRGRGFDGLTIRIPGCHLVLAVISGTIRLRHGAAEVSLCPGQAVAVSVPEIEIEIPPTFNSESVFILYFFQEMPSVEELGRESLVSILFEMQRWNPAGLFGFQRANWLIEHGAVPGGGIESAVGLMLTMFRSGLESTLRFYGSGRKTLENNE